jgi:integrase/recombinase XerD
VAGPAVRPLRRGSDVTGKTRRKRQRVLQAAKQRHHRERREPLELPFPAVLVPALEHHLAAHRPVLAAGLGRGRGRAGAALWLSAEGGPLSAVMLGHLVQARTRAAFGRVVNAHLFRDCAATSLAVEDPSHMRIAAQVLGHAAFGSTERYNLARGQEDSGW